MNSRIQSLEKNACEPSKLKRRNPKGEIQKNSQIDKESTKTVNIRIFRVILDSKTKRRNLRNLKKWRETKGEKLIKISRIVNKGIILKLRIQKRKSNMTLGN
jgi:hypothetical protein